MAKTSRNPYNNPEGVTGRALIAQIVILLVVLGVTFAILNSIVAAAKTADSNPSSTTRSETVR
jgi:hypothetical protein